MPWEHLKERLSATPPDFYNCALELLKEIKEGVANLTFADIKFLDSSHSLGMSVASKSQLNMVYESVRV